MTDEAFEPGWRLRWRSESGQLSPIVRLAKIEGRLLLRRRGIFDWKCSWECNRATEFSSRSFVTGSWGGISLGESTLDDDLAHFRIENENFVDHFRTFCRTEAVQHFCFRRWLSTVDFVLRLQKKSKKKLFYFRSCFWNGTKTPASFIRKKSALLCYALHPNQKNVLTNNYHFKCGKWKARNFLLEKTVQLFSENQFFLHLREICLKKRKQYMR